MMRRAILIVLSLIIPVQAFAVGGYRDTPSPDYSAEYNEGLEALGRQDWPKAIEAFRRVTQLDSRNADGWNYLGFAYRKSGDLPAAFMAYEIALRLDPDHRGAHEYIGEGYLQAGNLAKAEDHLARLATLCQKACPEYDMLKGKIEAYKARR